MNNKDKICATKYSTPIFFSVVLSSLSTLNNNSRRVKIYNLEKARRKHKCYHPVTNHKDRYVWIVSLSEMLDAHYFACKG